MPFTNKDVKLTEFMQRVRERLVQSRNDDAIIFFDSFLVEGLLESLEPHLKPDWDGIVNAGDFDTIYPMAAEILLDAATRNSSEDCPNIYGDASAVSFAFQEELNQTFQCSGDEIFDFLPIKSFSELMVESGQATLLRGPDGQKFIGPRESEED